MAGGSMARFVWCVWLAVAGVVSISAQPRLWISSGTNDFLRIRSTRHVGAAVILQSTTNLTTWQVAGHTLESFFNFPLAPNDAAQFYRLRIEPAAATNDWKNELLFAEEPLRSPDDQEIRWVKFLILRDDPTR